MVKQMNIDTIFINESAQIHPFSYVLEHFNVLTWIEHFIYIHPCGLLQGNNRSPYPFIKPIAWRIEMLWKYATKLLRKYEIILMTGIVRIANPINYEVPNKTHTKFII